MELVKILGSKLTTLGDLKKGIKDRGYDTRYSAMLGLLFSPGSSYGPSNKSGIFHKACALRIMLKTIEQFNKIVCMV